LRRRKERKWVKRQIVELRKASDPFTIGQLKNNVDSCTLYQGPLVNEFEQLLWNKCQDWSPEQVVRDSNRAKEFDHIGQAEGLWNIARMLDHSLPVFVFPLPVQQVQAQNGQSPAPQPQQAQPAQPQAQSGSQPQPEFGHVASVPSQQQAVGATGSSGRSRSPVTQQRRDMTHDERAKAVLEEFTYHATQGGQKTLEDAIRQTNIWIGSMWGMGTAAGQEASLVVSAIRGGNLSINQFTFPTSENQSCLAAAKSAADQLRAGIAPSRSHS